MHSIHDEGPAAVDLAAADLNLLVVFDALAREGSVTGAARRVGVTQSAMSHALRRLRGLFRDPLLVRGPRGMLLTPRAEALVVPVRSGLVALGRALAEPAGFEPATSRREFRLATPDLFDVLVVPPLLARLRREAPGVALAVVPVAPRGLAERLETGELDAAVVAHLDGQPPPLAVAGLVARTLLRDRFACFVRTGHPALRRRRAPLGLDTYVELAHLLVSPAGDGTGPVDGALASRGLSRRIALRIPHFYPALPIIAGSDLVLTAPAGLARVVPPGLSVATLKPPIRLPGHRVDLVWHQRQSSDLGHRWMRELVAATSAASAGRRRAG